MENKDQQISILLYVESRYKVNRKRIKHTIKKLLAVHEVSGSVEISVAIVGDRKMRALSRTYKGDDKTRNILTFSLSEGESSYIPSDVLHLGDIVISYPVLIQEASKENMLVDDRMDFLIEHGLQHLLGLHHE